MTRWWRAWGAIFYLVVGYFSGCMVGWRSGERQRTAEIAHVAESLAARCAKPSKREEKP
jgi:hypothetical protein